MASWTDYLKPQWRKMSDRDLDALRDRLTSIDPKSNDEQSAIWDAIERVDDERALRRAGPDLEPVDYDQQDRNAAASERIENMRRER